MSSDGPAVRSRGQFKDGPALTVEFPAPAQKSLGQDDEWCLVHVDGAPRRIRFHDYHEIYSIPGLYERLFYDHLECCSPATVRALLEEELERAGVEPAGLRILDLGAGNGMVGEELAEMGAGSIVGVDLIEEAAGAAARDRPGTYEDYLVLDLTNLSSEERRRLGTRQFNCLATVAALGFGDIPPRAFAEAYNLVADGGWIAFNIKQDFLDDGDGTGFSRLIGRLLESGILEERAQKVYRHRLSTTGDPLDYVAIVAVKRSDVPMALAAAVNGNG